MKYDGCIDGTKMVASLIMTVDVSDKIKKVDELLAKIASKPEDPHADR